MKEPIKLFEPVKDEMGGSRKKILCYAPYTYWKMTAMKEMTILQALKLRGADVHYILCNGVFSDCDIYLSCVFPQTPPNKCTKCQASGATLAYEMGLDYEWLGVYLSRSDYLEVKEWSDNLGKDELKTAQFNGWDIGEWVESSVHTDLRKNFLDFSDERIANKYRGYLYSGALAAKGLQRIIETDRPDLMLLFNGRMSSIRIAMEIARINGVKSIVYENGLMLDTLRLYDSTDCLSMQEVNRTWELWGNVPLSVKEIEKTRDVMEKRQSGSRMELKFSPPPQQPDEVLKALNLDPRKPIWLLLTSSDDELIVAKDLLGPLSQREWIAQTIAFCAKHPEITLVIRVHPNTAGKNTVRGDNLDLLKEMQEIRETLPANALMVMPDDPVSTYTLMDLCAVGLVYCSITGLELACKGKKVIAAAGGYITNKSFCVTLSNKDEYSELLNSVLQVPPRAYHPDIQRLAFRLAYGIFFRWQIPFGYIAGANADNCWLKYNKLDQLLPGLDPSLDRICRILMAGDDIITAPENADAITDSDETAWFMAQMGKNTAKAAPVKSETIWDDAHFIHGLDAVREEEWADAFTHFLELTTKAAADSPVNAALTMSLRKMHLLATGQKIPYDEKGVLADFGLLDEPASPASERGAGRSERMKFPAQVSALSDHGRDKNKAGQVDIWSDQYLDALIQKEDHPTLHQVIRYRWVNQVIAAFKPRRILDMVNDRVEGCTYLAVNHPEVQVVGLISDFNTFSKVRTGFVPKNLEFVYGNSNHWKFGEFDAMISFNTFTQTNHREITLQNIVKHMLPDGNLFFSTPCNQASPILDSERTGLLVEYSEDALLDLLQRYFRSILRPEDGSLPCAGVFDKINTDRIRYSLKMNPLICQGPRRYAEN